ncbi:hypothetical protein [Clostridium sp. E02]|nr:hypothetical protein [Clostridium sp. E02]
MIIANGAVEKEEKHTSVVTIIAVGHVIEESRFPTITLTIT